MKLDRFYDPENRYTEGFLKEFKHWNLEVSYLQTTLGSFIIFSKRNGVEKETDLTDEKIIELREVKREMQEALSANETFNPDRFNYWQMGNSLHHLHYHGIPRYLSPRVFDGKEWIDPDPRGIPQWAHEDSGHDLVRKLRDAIKPFIGDVT